MIATKLTLIGEPGEACFGLILAVCFTVGNVLNGSKLAVTTYGVSRPFSGAKRKSHVQRMGEGTPS
jgi:hypothetical protein